MVMVVMDKDGICRYSSLPLLVIKRYDNLALAYTVRDGLRVASALVEAFGALKKRRSKVLEGIDCRNKVRSRIQNNHKIDLLFNK